MNFKYLTRVGAAEGILLAIFLLLTSCGNDDDLAPAPDFFYNTPENVKIITSDVSLFWKIFDESGNGGYGPTTFKNDYFQGGTNALKLFFDQKIKSAEKLTANLNDPAIRSYYLGVRLNTQNLNNTSREIFEGLDKLEKLYSEAVFSDIVFVIGALSTGGTVVNNGQMVIGTEMFSVDDETPLDGLAPWQRAVVRDQTFLPSIVIHELIHVQQIRVSMEAGSSIINGKSLLDQALAEGISDFVTDLILGKFFNDFIHEYADPIEPDLWQEFKTEMNGTEVSNWLYNGSNSGDRPGDLGYYVGYKIAEHYYNQSNDKTSALKVILEAKNGENFLSLSGYEDKFN